MSEWLGILGILSWADLLRARRACALLGGRTTRVRKVCNTCSNRAGSDVRFDAPAIPVQSMRAHDAMCAGGTICGARWCNRLGQRGRGRAPFFCAGKSWENMRLKRTCDGRGRLRVWRLRGRRGGGRRGLITLGRLIDRCAIDWWISQHFLASDFYEDEREGNLFSSGQTREDPSAVGAVGSYVLTYHSVSTI